VIARRPLLAAMAVALCVPGSAAAADEAPTDPAPAAGTAVPSLEAFRPAANPVGETAPLPGTPVEGNAIDSLLYRLGAANPWRARLSDPLAEVRAPGAAPVAPPAAGELPFSLEAAQLKYDIPVEYNESVAKHLAVFQGPGRRWFGTWLARATQWVPVFRDILREYAVPEDLVYLAMIESGFSPMALSWAKAAGPWQFIEATGERYGLRTDFWVDERRDPIKATHAAARFLKRLREEFGDWYLAWAAYNAGPGRVTKAIEKEGTRDFWELQKTKAFRKETQDYVPKLIAAALIAKQPERFGFPEIERRDAIQFDEVEIPDATDLQVVARCAGTTVDEVKALNPELKRWATPPVDPGADPYKLRLPAGTAERFAEEFAKVDPKERFTFSGHVVKKGDTLGGIALHYGTSVEAISRANGGLSPKRLRIGQELVIPLPPGVKPKREPGKATPVAAAGAGRVEVARAELARAALAEPAPADATYHHLLPGETLGHLALRYGTTVDELKKWNRIRDVRKLRPGLRLRVR
jgi:membrane-bound lytic murein transglycosylase D